MKNQPKLYSYQRFSSTKQEKGTSIARQTSIAHEIATIHNLDFIDTFTDAGISAYKGKNSTEGALKAFLDYVECGKISRDSWLVVENLDRLTREDITEALALFGKITKSGITLVTGFDKKVISKEILNESPYMMFEILITFIRANEESKAKSKRTKGAALAQINQFNNGERSHDGIHAKPIQMGSHTWWSNTTNGTVKLDEYYAPIVSELVDMYINGTGKFALLAHLNANYTPPRKRKKWSISSIDSALIKGRYTLSGLKIITVDGVEYRLENYYPQPITDEQYNKLCYLIDNKPTKTYGDKHVGLLSNTKIFKCGHCGHNMTFSNTGKMGFRYSCRGGLLRESSNCREWTLYASYIEPIVLQLASDKVWQDDAEKPTNSELTTYQEHLNLVQEKIKTTSELFQDMPSKPLALSLQQFEKEQVDLEEKISQYFANNVDIGTPDWSQIGLDALDFENKEQRIKVREMVKHTFKKISLCRYKNVKGLEWGNNKRKYRFVFMIKLEFLDGTERYAFFNGLYSYTNNFGYNSFQGMKRMSQTKICEIRSFMNDESIQVVH